MSSTSPLKRALPAFRAASSPELDQLLSDVRLKYFLPAYLNRQQRKLVMSEKRSAMLETDPIYATFGDEEIQLRPLATTEVLHAKSTFLEVIARFKDRQDWRKNLSPLLEGFNRSGTKLQEKWLAKMTMAAEEVGALNTVVRCLAQVEKNGLSLRMAEFRKRLLLGLRRTAKAEGWRGAKKSLKTVEQVLHLMEHREHCGSRSVSDQDPRAEPYVIALPLELACRTEIKEDAMARKVEQYSTRLIASLAQQQTALDSDKAWRAPPGLQKPIDLVRALLDLDMILSEYVCVRNALMLARQVRREMWTGDEQTLASQMQRQVEIKLDLAADECAKLQSQADLTKFSTPGLDEWRQERSSK